jgi:hypothetical protein
VNDKVKKPDLILSMDDKIYLALMYKQVDGMGFIYSLVCPRTANSYSVVPESQMMTFKKTADAKFYYQALWQIKEFQENYEVFKKLQQTNKQEIDKFLSVYATIKNR